MTWFFGMIKHACEWIITSIEKRENVRYSMMDDLWVATNKTKVPGVWFFPDRVFPSVIEAKTWGDRNDMPWVMPLHQYLTVTTPHLPEDDK